MKRSRLFALLIQFITSSLMLLLTSGGNLTTTGTNAKKTTSATTKTATAQTTDVKIMATAQGHSANNRLTLGSWNTAAGELTLIAVTTRAFEKIQPTVHAKAGAYALIASGTSAQKVLSTHVFASYDAHSTNKLTLELPGNASAASAIALHVRGAKLPTSVKQLAHGVTLNPGPTKDNGDMYTTVTTNPGDTVIAFGANRLRNFAVPPNQKAHLVNVAAGTGGGRVNLSGWTAKATSPKTTLGAKKALVIGSGKDDWMMTVLPLTPAKQPARKASSVTLQVTPHTKPTGAPSKSASPANTSNPTPPGTGRPVAEKTPHTPTASPKPDRRNARPYQDSSAWNTPIPKNVQVLQRSEKYISTLAKGPALTSDTGQYTFTVYDVDSKTPRRNITMRGYYSRYVSDTERQSDGFAPTAKNIPIPPGAMSSAGTDGAIILLDRETGDEYAFWQFSRAKNGALSATNGYKYNTKWSGRFADGLAGRGAGTTYLGGLVRGHELDRGQIDHALAFGYRWPSKEFVYPASKSDGLGQRGVDLPEGSRLQLDPKYTEADFDTWGLDRNARTIARALQKYGMYVVDNSGSPKVYVEDDQTTSAAQQITRNSLSAIPWSAFRVVRPPTP